MKLVKRLIALILLVVVLSTIITLLVLHFFGKKMDRRHSFEKAGSFEQTVEFNSDPSAIFYKLDNSPLAQELGRLDRRKLTPSLVMNFALKPEVVKEYKKNEVDVGISDLVPLNRPVPDSRPAG